MCLHQPCDAVNPTTTSLQLLTHPRVCCVAAQVPSEKVRASKRAKSGDKVVKLTAKAQ